jgi:hypothetical protein
MTTDQVLEENEIMANYWQFALSNDILVYSKV